MKNFQKRLAGLSLGLLMTLGVGAVVGQHGALSVKAEETKSSMQIAYEAAAALGKGKTTSSAYTFTGVITNTSGTSFTVQDGDYAIYCFTYLKLADTKVEIGKTVTVTSTLSNYNGMLETSQIQNTSNIIIGENGALPTNKTVSSLTELQALKQNVLVDVEVSMPSDLSGLTWSPYKSKSDTGNSPLPECGLGEDKVVVKFPKDCYTEEKGAIYNDSAKRRLSIKNLIVSTYDKTNGAITPNQFLLGDNSILSVIGKEDAETYATTFLSKTDTICGDGSGADKTALEEVWAELQTSYTSLSDDAKNYLATASADNVGTVVEKAMARHDHIVNRYGLAKIVTNRTVSTSNHSVIASADNSSTITIIVLVSVLSVSLIVGTSLIVRKRKVN